MKLFALDVAGTTVLLVQLDDGLGVLNGGFGHCVSPISESSSAEHV